VFWLVCYITVIIAETAKIHSHRMWCRAVASAVPHSSAMQRNAHGNAYCMNASTCGAVRRGAALRLEAPQRNAPHPV